MAQTEPLFTIEFLETKVNVMAEDVDDIMDSAMNGCTYWCGSAEPVDGYLGDYASEQVSRGGTLTFYPFEDEPEELDLDKFKAGLQKWLLSLKYDIIHVMDGQRIDPACIDAEDADSILQYALFDDIIYG